MKRYLIIFVLLLAGKASFNQKLTGQWKGYFDSNGNSSIYSEGNTEYVLELDINGSEISGSSYSYFSGRKYYVICTLSGTFDKKSKKAVITETRRVKGNTPFEEDCLQVHTLMYVKEDNIEKLIGTWKPVPNQKGGGGCGVGSTELTRRTLKNDLASYNKNTKVSPFSAPKIKPPYKEVAKNTVKPRQPEIVQNNTKRQPVNPLGNNKAGILPASDDTAVAPSLSVQEKKAPESIVAIKSNFEKRDSKILNTINLKNETFKIDLYDNGTVDGDSVSLFYNGKLILTHQRLTTRPITVMLTANADETNELTMYAENLGEIPPNTALMVITDGNDRYEARIESDLNKSGTIRFVHKK